MFEDSTFETMGRIQTRSRGWMMATLAFNSSILLALAIIPIIHPEMLPQITNAIPMEEPAPVQDVRPVVRTEQAPTLRTEMPNGVILVPRQIPSQPWIPGAMDDPGPMRSADIGGGLAGAGGPDNPFNGGGAHPDVRPAAPAATQHVSSGVMQGMLIYKVIPTYPAIAQAIRASGTVVLAGDHLADGRDRKSARGGGAGDVAEGGARCGEAVALPAVHAERPAGGGGDRGGCGLHAGLNADGGDRFFATPP